MSIVVERLHSDTVKLWLDGDSYQLQVAREGRYWFVSRLDNAGADVTDLENFRNASLAIEFAKKYLQGKDELDKALGESGLDLPDTG